jgi:hypothetical protein
MPPCHPKRFKLHSLTALAMFLYSAKDPITPFNVQKDPITPGSFSSIVIAIIGGSFVYKINILNGNRDNL